MGYIGVETHLLTFYPVGWVTSPASLRSVPIFWCFFGNRIAGSTKITLLHEKINPKNWQALSLGDAGFLQFFKLFCIRISHPPPHKIIGGLPNISAPQFFLGLGGEGKKHFLFHSKHLPARWAPILVINGVLQVGLNDSRWPINFRPFFVSARGPKNAPGPCLSSICQDSQRFYLFKILRAHILPLTNCAFNKSLGKILANLPCFFFFSVGCWGKGGGEDFWRLCWLLMWRGDYRTTYWGMKQPRDVRDDEGVSNHILNA